MISLTEAVSALASARAAAPDGAELAGLHDIVAGALRLVALRQDRDGGATPAGRIKGH
jgi:hypothetical protein